MRPRHPVVIMAAFFYAACGGDSVKVEPKEWLPGGDATNTLLFASNAFAFPAANITAKHEAMFHSGNSFFNRSWVEAPSSTKARNGLGPTFNARSCSGCHFRDGRGRPPASADELFLGLLLRLSIDGQGANGEPAPDPAYGGQLQPFSIPGVPVEGTPRLSYTAITETYDDGEQYTRSVPRYEIGELAFGPLDPNIRISPRVAPAMVGLGLLAAIPASRLRAFADPDDANRDGISGRINQVWDVASQSMEIGRFGWKAEQPSVHQQSAGAFVGDIGITSVLFTAQDCPKPQTECGQAMSGGTPELSDLILDQVDVYASLLAVPARQDYESATVLHGKRLFSSIGCASCHVPRHLTGTVERFPEVSHQKKLQVGRARTN